MVEDIRFGVATLEQVSIAMNSRRRALVRAISRKNRKGVVNANDRVTDEQDIFQTGPTNRKKSRFGSRSSDTSDWRSTMASGSQSRMSE
jgi:hypothetical protein